MSGAVRRIRRTIAITGIAVALVASLAAPATGSRDRLITVMTRNLYLGTDLNPILGAPDLPSLLGAVGAAWNQVQASQPRERLDAIAGEIAAHQPDLVGLQEVSLWRTDVPPDGPVTPATDVAFDFLDLLLGALADRGLIYEAVATSTNFDAEIPAGFPPQLDVRLTDRDVIIARADLPASRLKVSNPMHAVFDTAFPIPTPAGPLAGIRGWTSVDVKVRGTSFRLINTHLETEAVPPAQIGQAAELLAGPAAAGMPALMIGDFNSAADGSTTPTYGLITAAGFADAWSAARPGEAGPTCCQDGDLLNPVSALGTRIDVIFSRGGFDVRGAQRTGAAPGDRTESGLWPSDHAGVVAQLAIPKG